MAAAKPFYKRPSFWKRLSFAFLIAIFSGFVGEMYGYVFYPEEAFDYYVGFRIGASVGLVSSLIEIFYIRSVRRSWIRRVAFFPGLLVRILVLTLIVRLCLVGNIALTDVLLGSNISLELKFADQVRDTIFSMAIVIVLVILSQLTSVIGFKRFVNLVVGRYFRPLSENRVFMFVDMVDSSQIAKRFGDVRFHEFLSELFYQIDQAIVRTGGEIVSYVGDAVIVTWPLTDDKKRNARVLLSLRSMLDRLEDQSGIFDEEFGETPRFRAAIHGGPVVVGECGDSRRQVTFLGDVVNMTARIETATKVEGERFLISDFMTQQMKIPMGVRVEAIGGRSLKGYEEPVMLNRIIFEPT